MNVRRTTSVRLPRLSLLLVASLLALGTGYAKAQSTVAPDVGQILQQQNRNAPSPPRAPVALPVPAITTDNALPGGAQVLVQTITFSGNHVLATPTLQALVADAVGQRLNLAGLRALAERVGAHYRASGYPFARAYLPAQDLAQGVLRIDVLEGRHGQPHTTSAETGWAKAGQAYLAPLKPGEVIERSSLERITLLLADLPGVRSSALMQPGTQVGTGDLVVDLSRSDPFTASLTLDNTGNRYSGQQRAGLNLDWASPFAMGDRLSLRALGTNENLWLGSVTYSAELGAEGWRGTAALASTRYELGREFAALGATGSAQVASLGAGYAALRTNSTNMKLSGTLQHKALRDKQGSLSERKRSSSVALQLDFDHRDSLGGGGISYGNVSLTPGRLYLSGADVNKTAGGFTKFNLDVVRLQALRPDLNGHARVVVQHSGSSNLDSSERMSLGGVNGVRAFPSSEGTGDRGWLVQTELRASLGEDGSWGPYLLADAGRVRLSHRPVTPTINNHRGLAGAGVGLRLRWQALELNTALAWEVRGGNAQADGGAGSSPRWTASATYRIR